MEKDLREIVRQKYAEAITAKSGCGCGSGGCCGGSSDATSMVTGGLYQSGEVADLPADMLATSLGCGNPTALADLHAGEKVLDLGSGAGLDVLLSARRVGPSGHAFGLDMTDEMLAAARANQAKADIANATFLKGHIEEIPLPDNAVDIVISNCVINLSADKSQVFREIFRVLRPGGRVAVSDIVTTKPLPEKLRQNLAAWAGCVAGALEGAEYAAKLAAAGFTDTELVVTRVYDTTDPAAAELIAGLTPQELADLNGAVVSAFIRAKKPPIRLSAGIDFRLRPADAGDLPAIAALLAAEGLPTVAIAENIASFTVADRSGVVGVIGAHISGRSAILRSFVVAPDHRKTGIAAALVDHTIARATAAGAEAIYLLTDTAPGYFARRGFAPVPRAAVPDSLLADTGLGAACPSCSAMTLVLGGYHGK